MSDVVAESAVEAPARSTSDRLALGGFGPLVVAAILAVLAVLLVPSIAPEQVVTRPVEMSSTTTASLPGDPP